MNPSEVRSLFPILEKRAYLFSGGIAPTTTRSLRALQQHIDYLTYDADDLYMHTLDDFVEVRRLFAELIGAAQDEVAITDCTGTGANLAVEMVEPLPGSNVVFDESAYPSAAYPWMLPPRAHVERRFVKGRDGLIHLDDLSAAIDDRTIAVSVSHVSQETGFRHDLAAVAKLAHQHGAVLLVDAMQSTGALRIDVHEQDVDFLATGAMKWLLGSAGVGFFYAAKRHLERMPPHAGGQGAVTDDRPWDLREFKPKEGAERFHVGMPNLIGLAGTKSGLEILLETGMDAVEEQVLDLSGYCIAGMRERSLNVLTPMQPEHRAGVVAATMEDASQLWEFLYQRGVDTFYHGSLFRVDPHVFNNREDIDRFLEGVDAYPAQR